MRINRNMLLKIANDAVEKYVRQDHSLMAAYLQGSLLGEEPLIGNTADIDLFFIHNDEVSLEREIIRVSDEVSLDISHHSHMVYRQPREMRLHPWLGPAIYSCRSMYDPQHFIDFTQASVRGQFYNPETVLGRVRKQAEHAREIWEGFIEHPHQPNSKDCSLFLHALEHAANAIAGLSGPNLTERRFLLDLPHKVEYVHQPGMYQGFLGLLGAPSVDSTVIKSWLADWHAAYSALPAGEAPIRLHPYRLPYYERAFEAMLEGSTAHDVLWPLWRTWTHAIGILPAKSAHQSAWRAAGEQLGLLGAAFTEKIEALDAYLDLTEEVLDIWARENGG